MTDRQSTACSVSLKSAVELYVKLTVCGVLSPTMRYNRNIAYYRPNKQNISMRLISIWEMLHLATVDCTISRHMTTYCWVTVDRHIHYSSTCSTWLWSHIECRSACVTARVDSLTRRDTLCSQQLNWLWKHHFIPHISTARGNMATACLYYYYYYYCTKNQTNIKLF